ncbi:MAG TPA: DNA recombination protein RmuC [Tepidisphaeraceae bacterium]|nr:DNA recombination protein RmuC [Tepidisphaeraceae bacterium]
MEAALLSIILLLLLAILGLLAALWRRRTEVDLSGVDRSLERTERGMRDELGGWFRSQTQTADQQASSLRKEISENVKTLSELLAGRVSELGGTQRTQLSGITDQLARLIDSNEKKLESLRTDNNRQLELMRATVDEKLQGALEKRLGESFKQVSDRLEAVHKGLGEMQALASGVGDLKRVLTNVKTRGTWGEVQLGALLEQMLTQDQFARNVSTRRDDNRVDFAVRLPGRAQAGHDDAETVWLPIDAKFPTEDYQRLLEAQERADAPAAEEASRQLACRLRQFAAGISEKYLNPPHTTDFAILFLPTEGLFAEAVRRVGLVEQLQRESKVMLAGPTTLACLLNCFQMGFQTLAIQQRSSEVWTLLGAVKTEWSKYGEILERVKKKLDEASSTIDNAQQRNRVIGRKLKSVQELPAEQAQEALLLDQET